MRLFISALIALNIALIRAAPQNNAEVAREAAADVKAVAEKKGAPGSLVENLGYMSDDAMVKTCVSGQGCEFMTYGQAKGLEAETISAIAAAKGESAVSKALSPTLAEMQESLNALKAQKAMLESLGQSLGALTAASNKGQQLAEAAKGQFAATMSRGLSFDKGANEPAEPGFGNKGGFASAPQFNNKGPQAPSFDKGFQAPAFGPSSLSKGGFSAPPSKGGSMASSMQLEAMMCPMTTYELKKSLKMASEMKLQLEASISVNGQLMAEKQRLEAALAASEMMRLKAQQEAQFNAKVAGEEKARADAVTDALGRANMENDNLNQQKAQLEEELSNTTQALSEERSKNDELTAVYQQCDEERTALNQSLAEQTSRAENAEQQLADTKARLEEETDARIDCEETLTFTQNRLNKSENDLKNEREAREQTEKELMDTMTQLASCNREVRVTSEILNRTQDELQAKTAALAREEAAREALQTKLDSTMEQLRSTEQELRDTQRALEDEQNAHAKTQRQLNETQEELEATEEARRALEEAKQNLEDELAETKSQLDSMTAERDQLQTTLDATSAALAESNAQKMQCDNDLAAQKSMSEQLGEQLGEALMMLKMEKEAREQLSETIQMVQQASMKVQEEVQKLQTENVLLQAQVEKLKKEQESALALAAGCPPMYEKFGTSCYRYVREKAQWKMAQEQCMKDMGNLVSIEDVQEQIFVTNYLKRHGADDAYSFTSGNKQFNGWKWLGAENNHMGASGVEFWYNDATKAKPGYDCQALYLYDPMKYGQWVGLPCYNAAHFVCEYNLLPPGAPQPNNPAEQMAVLEMAKDAPPYLSMLARQ